MDGGARRAVRAAKFATLRACGTPSERVPVSRAAPRAQHATVRARLHTSADG